MLALINTMQYEEVLGDLNNIIFNILEPKALAIKVWKDIEEMVEGGATEELVYMELHRLLEEHKTINKGD